MKIIYGDYLGEKRIFKNITTFIIKIIYVIGLIHNTCYKYKEFEALNTPFVYFYLSLY